MLKKSRAFPNPIRFMRKLIRADCARPTRFHTERGQVVPMRTVVQLPGLLFARVTGTRDVPWMVPEAVSLIESVIEASWRVAEFGAGASTVWLSRRVSNITSFEHDAALARELRKKVAGRGNVQVIVLPLQEFVRALCGLPDGSLDLVIVDSSEVGLPTELARPGLVQAARSKVRPGGFLVLDNSDRVRYRPIDELLVGWRSWRFPGLVPKPLTATETTVYQRAGES